MSTILAGFLGSLAAGLATALGALPVLIVRQVSERMQIVLLGSAAGVMLAASFFSLILPGLEAARDGGLSEPLAVLTIIGGIAIGAAGVAALDAMAPHEHFIKGPEGRHSESLRRIWLFVVAIAIHNLPEGLAVGVGFGEDFANGRTLAIGIGLQNLPEGLAVALALRGQGYSSCAALSVALVTGLVEPVGGLIGGAAVSISQAVLPWGLAFAAGAMLFVISHEIIPETHRRRSSKAATAGLIGGFGVMMFLDTVLG